MQKKFIFILLAITVSIVQTACSFGPSPIQPPQPTQDVNAVVQTGIALTQAANVVVVPTDTMAPVVVLPTVTSAPVIPTNTVTPAVSGVINYTANCRSGPGANFLALAILNPGTQVTIIGTNKATDGSLWWVVQSTGNADCWMVDGAVSITGDKKSVAVVVSPPTPTPLPIPTWGGTWTWWQFGNVNAEITGTMILTQTGNQVDSNTMVINQWGRNWFITLHGTVDPDGMTVRGYISVQGDVSYTTVFKRNPSNLNQFRGSFNFPGYTAVDISWCGSINGAPKPSPCKSN